MVPGTQQILRKCLMNDLVPGRTYTKIKRLYILQVPPRMKAQLHLIVSYLSLDSKELYPNLQVILKFSFKKTKLCHYQ